MPVITINSNNVNLSAVRDHAMDTLRAVAITAVVFHHAAWYFVDVPTTIRNDNILTFWTIAASLTATKIAVPIFIMLSGRFLLGRVKEPLWKFYKKRAVSVGVPLVVWSVIYSFYSGSSNILYELIAGSAHFHQLWFFYTLIGLYALTPYITNLFARWKISPLSLGTILMIFGVFFNILLFLAGGHFDTHPYFNIVLMSGYYVLGFGFKKHSFRSVSKVLLSSIFIGTIFVGTWLSHATYLQDIGNDYFNTYLSPVTVAGSVSFYLLASKARFSSRILSQIAPYTLGIYAIHTIVLEQLVLSGMFSTYSLISMLVLATLAYIISLSIVKLISTLPILRYIV